MTAANGQRGAIAEGDGFAVPRQAREGVSLDQAGKVEPEGRVKGFAAGDGDIRAALRQRDLQRKLR
jgi:hypothetical protein